jgi:hypothetical protein
MRESKTVWVTPELIVLTRKRPEEAVLAACKWDSSHSGPNVSFGACERNGTDCELACDANVPS